MAKDRRRKILKAAESLLGNRRIHEVTMDDVAQAAGVGKGTIYRYFENKESLFAELADAGFDELYENIRSTPVGSESFRADLTAVCSGISDFFARRMTLMRVMTEAEDREACAKRRFRQNRHVHRERLHSELRRWLEEGVGCGELRDDLPLDLLASSLLSMIRSQVRHDGHDGAPAVDQVIAIFVDGCRRRSDS